MLWASNTDNAGKENKQTMKPVYSDLDHKVIQGLEEQGFNNSGNLAKSLADSRAAHSKMSEELKTRNRETRITLHNILDTKRKRP